MAASQSGCHQSILSRLPNHFGLLFSISTFTLILGGRLGHVSGVFIRLCFIVQKFRGVEKRFVDAPTVLFFNGHFNG